MTDVLLPQYSPVDLYNLTQHTIESWRLLKQAQIQRIDYHDRGELAQFQMQDGDSELAQSRIEHLEPIAQKRWTKFLKRLIEGFIIFLGALTFSTVSRLLASSVSDSSFALGIGLLGGSAAAWLTHDRATRALGKIRARHDSLQALASIAQQHQAYPVQNELVDYFFQGQKARLLQVEADNLKAQFWMDLLLAIAVSLLEGVTAYILVQGTGPLTATLVGIFPVSIIWLAAVFQSDRGEFAEACAELVHDYSAFLPNGQISEEQLLRVYVLNATVQHFTAVTPSGIRTVKGARARAKSEFAQMRIDQLEAEGIQAVKLRKQHYRQAIDELPQRFPMSQKFNVAGYREFEVCHEQQYAEQQQIDRIEKECIRLQQELDDDLKLLQTEYTQQIQKWQRIKAEADQIFNAELSQ